MKKRGKDKENISCDNMPPWYLQLIRLDEDKHQETVANTLEKIKQAKPDVHKFIVKNNMELIGFIPNIQYAMANDSEGYLGVTFVHDFSQYTLLYWCDAGFGLFVNPSVSYNDGVRGLSY